MSYALTINGTAVKAIGNVMRKLGAEGRKTIFAQMGAAGEVITRAHVAILADSKHATAKALGAKQTGFYRDAVDAVRSYADTTSATVIIDHPGFANARRAVEISPINGKFLTIPTHAMSYGKRAREFDKDKTFIRKSRKGGLFIWYKPGNGRILPLYMLVRGVKKPMDATLLPPDEDYGDAAAVAFRDYFKALAAQAQIT